MPFDQRRDDALRRHLGDAGNRGNALSQIGGERLVGGLHGEQARGDVHERRARDDDQIRAHAREAARHAFP